MTYPFRCTACSLQFEVNVPVDNRDLPQPCPTCGPGLASRDTSAQFGSLTINDLPMYMSDSNMSARVKHRDWLKTPEAKKMDLDPSRDG